MAYFIKQSESDVSKACVYLWVVSSDGSSAATHEAGGQPKFSIGGIPAVDSAGTLLDVDSAVGLYAVTLSASNVSLLGPGVVRYSSTTVPMSAAAIEVVAFDPFAALSVFSSGDSVGLKAQTHSGATVGVGGIALGTYSGVTVGTNNIAAGSYSGVTIAGVTRVNSSVTLADATYSAVTIGGVTGGVNTTKIAGVTITGNGQVGTEFGV